ncbi:MAG: LysR family transcriptional regulator [Moraxella sp.]|nr:LysR family transcriptional regulator [Moraxella sp.]
MNVTLRQLKAFASIAECKSFTKAADELHLTQSSLSGLIKEMEKNLEVRLFDRTTRQLYLSDAGERLLPYALRILSELRLLDNEITNLKDFHQGKIRLAASQQLAASAMPELINRFVKAHPNIQVTLIDCSVEEVINRVQLLEADFGIGPERVLSSDVAASELFASEFCLVVRPEHYLASCQAIEWRQLVDEDLIILQGPFAKKLLTELPTQVSHRLFRADYEVNFLSTALGMTQMGLGITLAMPYARTWVDQHGLVMIPLKAPVISRKFLLYTHKRRSPSAAINVFKEFLIQHTAQWSLS